MKELSEWKSKFNKNKQGPRLTLDTKTPIEIGATGLKPDDLSRLKFGANVIEYHEKMAKLNGALETLIMDSEIKNKIEALRFLETKEAQSLLSDPQQDQIRRAKEDPEIIDYFFGELIKASTLPEKLAAIRYLTPFHILKHLSFEQKRQLKSVANDAADEMTQIFEDIEKGHASEVALSFQKDDLYLIKKLLDILNREIPID